jgi:flagellar biosynthetic protein FliQ
MESDCRLACAELLLRRRGMNPDVVLRIAKDMIEITLFISLPIMGIGLIVGLLVSLFQSLTQMHEMTLVFVPKIVAVLLGLLFLLPWMMQKLVFYTQNLIVSLPQYAR